MNRAEETIPGPKLPAGRKPPRRPVNSLLLAEARLRVRDARVLGGAGQRIALLDRDLVIGIPLVLCSVAAGCGGLFRRGAMRVGGDPVDLRVGDRFRMRGLGFLY